MKFKLIQADTRHLLISTKSKKLIYAPENEVNERVLHQVNNNVMNNIQDPTTMSVLVNALKMKICGYSYELVNFDDDNLPFDKQKKCLFWIKILALINQINPSSPPLIAFIDSDAWIRDEVKFMAFVDEFEKSSYTIALAKDVQQKNTSLLNSGFIICKNNEKAKQILEHIYYHPEYAAFQGQDNFWEQGALSKYYIDHPEDIQALSMEDFNTPCGNIVRHCWIKHWLTNSLLDEIYAMFTKITLSSESNTINLGNLKTFFNE